MISEASLARTYSPPAYANGWECVQDYRTAMRHVERHPNDNSTAVARALGLPRGRVRPWLDGQRPDAARAIAVARENGWLDPDPDDTTFRGLNACVAWCLSGGSVGATNYVPRFVLRDEDDRTRLQRIAAATGIELTPLREPETATDRPAEYKPAEHGCVLGRVLALLGVPVGFQRSKEETVLPEYLYRVPQLFEYEFGRIVVRNNEALTATEPTVICRGRAESFRDDVAALLERVTGTDTDVTDRGVRVSAAVIDGLRERPPVLD
jgi:hypothetical protein